MGAAGKVDFVLALHFCTLAQSASLSHFTFALRRRAGAIGDICRVI